MNAIDILKNQTLSTIITHETKEIIVKERTKEMTSEEYDKILDEYEAKYVESDNSDIGTDITLFIFWRKVWLYTSTAFVAGAARVIP